MSQTAQAACGHTHTQKATPMTEETSKGIQLWRL